jgi:hypothetical protein
MPSHRLGCQTEQQNNIKNKIRHGLRSSPFRFSHKQPTKNMLWKRRGGSTGGSTGKAQFHRVGGNRGEEDVKNQIKNIELCNNS